MADQDSFQHYETALVVLQTPSSNLDARMSALRHLKLYVDGRIQIDQATRRRINQAVLEGVLEIVMTEERTSDLRKRQLMRTESFLILADLLDSKALFGDTQKKIEEIRFSNMERKKQEVRELRELTASNTLDRQSLEPSSGKLESGETRRAKSSQGRRFNVSFTLDDEISRRTLGGNHDDAFYPSKFDDTKPLMSKSTSQLKLNLIKDVLKKKPISHITNVKLKPRPSVFYDSEYKLDSFVPGADPTNWHVQDKKLGYQKSRMWFPLASLGVDGEMAPQDRPGPGQMLSADRVVHEYLQMKALLSYVGDVVAPIQGKKTAWINANIPNYPTGGLSKRVAGLTDADRYEETMRQAVTVWTPLVGSHLPEWARRRRRWTDEHLRVTASMMRKAAVKSAADFVNDEESGASSLDASSQSMTSSVSDIYGTATLSDESASTLTKKKKNAGAPSASDAVSQQVERQIMFTKGVLRRLLRKEIKGIETTHQTLRE